MENSKLMRSIAVVVVIAALVVPGGCALWTGRGVVPGKSQGTASVTVTGRTLEEVEAAIHAVFVADRFKQTLDAHRQKVYERPGSRMKDVSYGRVGSDGVVERAFLEIHDEGPGVHRVECNVHIVTGTGESFLDDETEVLKLFGRQYQRLLRRVARRLR